MGACFSKKTESPIKHEITGGEEAQKKVYKAIKKPKPHSSLIKNVLWVDQNIKNEENQKYCSQLKSQYGITVEQFIDINSLFIKMKEIKFDIAIIIISGELIGNYLEKFKEEQIDLYIIPIQIIFTNNKNDIINLLQNEHSEDLNNDLINIENIASNKEFENLLNKYLKDEQSLIDKGNLKYPDDYNDCFTFEYIEEKGQLIYPYLYDKIMKNKKVSHSEINNFNVFLLENFGGNSGINEIISKLIKAGNISNEIIAKCWARVYTFESSFYPNLNWNLMQLNNQQYNTFIRILYSGLKYYSYKGNQNLFRGSIIANNEMEKIKEFYNKKGNSKDCENKVMIFSRTYLSFSLNEDTALGFIKYKEGYSSVLFELLNDEKKNSNAIISSFSVFPGEAEILFFPFSSFLIKEIIDENQNLTRIKLEYLGIYENIIKENMKKNKKAKNSKFLQEVIDSQSISNENNINKEIFSKEELKYIKYIVKSNKKGIPENEGESIICEYDIKIDKINKPIQILNSYEEVKRKDPYRDWKNIKEIENEKEIKENCEIYLNDKKIDFCYEYIFEKEDKNEIKIISKTTLKNTNFMFYNCSSLTSLNLSNFNTNNVNNMSYMFWNCSSLTSLNLSNFNTNNVEDMSYMFWNCSSLKSLDLSNFNTNNVNKMRSMFSGCSSLTSLNLSNFNTDNVNDMSYMFDNCSSLQLLDLSNLKTNNVNNMRCMFQLCSSLNSLNLSNFNTDNVKNMRSMFYNCSSLKSLDLSNFNTNNVEDMSSMFYNCSSLTSLNLSNFNTNNVEDMSYMFCGCSSINSLNSTDKRLLKELKKKNLFKSKKNL